MPRLSTKVRARGRLAGGTDGAGAAPDCNRSKQRLCVSFFQPSHLFPHSDPHPYPPTLQVRPPRGLRCTAPHPTATAVHRRTVSHRTASGRRSRRSMACLTTLVARLARLVRLLSCTAPRTGHPRTVRRRQIQPHFLWVSLPFIILNERAPLSLARL